MGNVDAAQKAAAESIRRNQNPGAPEELPPGQPDETPPMDPRPPNEIPVPDQPDELPQPLPGEVPPEQPDELPQPGGSSPSQLRAGPH